MIESYLDSWELTEDGEPIQGNVSLIYPVRMKDGTPAMLKFDQQRDSETEGEGAALNVWDGDGAVRLYREEPGVLLLERLGTRHLGDLPDPLEATYVIAGLLARLTEHRAPQDMRKLRDIIANVLSRVPAAAGKVPPDQGKLMLDWTAQVKEVAQEPGNQLLHWDLHFENVLASEREPWLAIDPKPLAGTPAFELLPALQNRWDPDQVRRRFHIMTDVLGLQRDVAVGWTLGRVLQNLVWFIEEGASTIDPVQHAIATTLT